MTTKATGTAVEVLEQANVPAAAEDSFLTIFQVSTEKGYEPAFIEKMMELQERNDANNARKAFFDDFANCKAEMPPVKKDKYNKFFDSWYTSLGMLLDTYNPILGRYGLVLQFPSPEQDDKSMTVECRLVHRLGHSESVSMKGPIDTAAIGKQSGQRSRNPIQDLKSTFTYLRSVTCESILGVAGTEGTGDDDGNSASSVKYITEAQVDELKKLSNERTINGPKFLKHFKVESLDEISATRFAEALQVMKSKPKKETAAQKEREVGDDDGEWMDDNEPTQEDLKT